MNVESLIPDILWMVKQLNAFAQEIGELRERVKRLRFERDFAWSEVDILRARVAELERRIESIDPATLKGGAR